MAHLNDRGQLILITAFVLAVTFVALALVANSAIFTENLATRGDTTGGSDALLYRHEVEGNVANVTEYVNEHNTSDLPEKVDRSIRNMSVQGGVQNARKGRVISVGFESGSALLRARLFQNNNSRRYVNASGNGNWTLARDAELLREAEFNVSTADLETVTRENRSDAFNFIVNDSTSSWNMSVYEPRNASFDMNVTVEDTSGTTATCTANGDFVVINVTSGTVGGAPCSELSDGYPSSNTTRFENGGDIRGNYSISLENHDSVDPANFNASASPVADVWIEHLNVTYTYETASLRYNTTFMVIPDD